MELKRELKPAEALTHAQDLFIRRWGEMAASWGVSRTMAEIHALLYIAEAPLCADEIMEKLQVSRGSASMNLRDLVQWELVRRIHKAGDRRDYYQADTDAWQMFQTIARERRRRELEPITDTIRRCLMLVDAVKKDKDPKVNRSSQVFAERLQSMEEFLAVVNMLFNAFLAAGPESVRALMKMTPGLGQATPAKANAVK